MRQLDRFVLLVLFILYSLFQNTVLANDKFTIRGQVTDATSGESLVGTNIIIVDTKMGASSDSSGFFQILNIPTGSYKIKASYIGYEPAYQNIDLPSQTPQQLFFELRRSFFQTEQVVVTATRTKKLMENVPVVTELITEQEIEETGAEDLADVLDDRPGIFISENDVGGKNIRMGGVDGKYILVLIDGMPVSGKFNNRQELNLIDADLIERVEIVKGPSSAIYGSEAMGGVINIITKQIQNDFSVDFKGKTGSYDLYSGNARISTKVDSVGISVGFDFTQGGVDPNLASLNVRNSSTSLIGAKIDYRSNRVGDFEFNLARQNDEQNGQDPLFAFDTDLIRTDGRLSWRQTFHKKVAASIRAYASEYDRDYREIVKRSGFIRTQNAGVETIFGVKSDFSYTFSEQNRLDVGVDYSYDQYDSKRVSVSSEEPTTLIAQRELVGFFAQAELAPIRQLMLLLGGRYDQMSDVPSHFSPRLSGMYNFTSDLKLRASYGGGFRAPSFNDMYIDFNHTSFGYRVIGNPDLVPEKSTGSSFGLEYFWDYKILTNVTVYRNYFTDMIVDYPVDPVNLPGTLSYKNIDQATIHTIEVQSKYYVTKNLTTQLAYNYTAIAEQEAAEEVLNMPPHTASIKLNWTFWRAFELSFRDQWFGAHTVREFEPLIGDYVDRLTTKKAFHLTDATLTFHPREQTSGRRQFEGFTSLYTMLILRFGVTNLADYTDLRYGPWLGRRFFLTLEINY